MFAYNKLLAAILSTLVMRWTLRWLGIDMTELGVGDDFRSLVELALDASIAALNGFFVWLVPNVEMRWREAVAWVKERTGL